VPRGRSGATFAIVIFEPLGCGFTFPAAPRTALAAQLPALAAQFPESEVAVHQRGTENQNVINIKKYQTYLLIYLWF